MSNLADIKARMKVIRDTRKITGAMETISVAKMGKAIQICEQNAAYFNKLKDVMCDIVEYLGAWDHQCFKNASGNNPVFLVIASDKGLVGGYNHNLFAFAESKLGTYKNPSVMTVGEMTKDFFDKTGYRVMGEFCDATFDPTIEEAEEIAEYLLDLFLTGKADEINIIYTSYHSVDGMKPDIIKLLPLIDRSYYEQFLDSEKENYLKELYCEPSPERVLERIIPQYSAGIIYGCLLQSIASEHLSRRAAMTASTKNADELLEKLQTDYNRARQGGITSEITDIITAVSGVDDEEK